MKKSNHKMIRLALGALALASTVTVFQPRIALGGFATQQTCPGAGCNGGDDFCATITWSATGTQVTCYDWDW